MPNVMDELSKPETQERSSTPVRGPRRSARMKVLALVVLMGLAATAVGLYYHFRDRVSSDDANVDGHITAIAPKISGTVLEVLVLDNQAVKAGQVLMRIDPRDFQA